MLLVQLDPLAVLEQLVRLETLEHLGLQAIPDQLGLWVTLVALGRLVKPGQLVHKEDRATLEPQDRSDRRVALAQLDR